VIHAMQYDLERAYHNQRQQAAARQRFVAEAERESATTSSPVPLGMPSSADFTQRFSVPPARWRYRVGKSLSRTARPCAVARVRPIRRRRTRRRVPHPSHIPPSMHGRIPHVQVASAPQPGRFEATTALSNWVSCPPAQLGLGRTEQARGVHRVACVSERVSHPGAAEREEIAGHARIAHLR
jgi:hypothetical protein